MRLRSRRPPALWADCLAVWAMALGTAVLTHDAAGGEPRKSQQEWMAERGLVRSNGAWRTVQEIELIERGARATLAQKEWVVRLERLRKKLDVPAQADRATEEIREIADPFAVPALAKAATVLIAVAIDHPDPETRIAATERLLARGPHVAVPSLVAALSGADNARINRAAEALGRLGASSAVGPLINALQTEHTAVVGDGTPEGSTSATFTPSGGGLSMGGGAKRVTVVAKNDRVLESLVTLTGANFEWNAAAWRAWLANRDSPADFDPRRSVKKLDGGF